MSNIINKSNHPVEIKRINVRIWKFRDEIEKAITLRLIESNKEGVELNIEDIKEFYTRNKPNYLDPNYDPDDNEDEKDEEESTDSEDEDTPKDSEDSEDSADSESSEDEEKAAKLAKEIIDDQPAADTDQKSESKKPIDRVVPDDDRVSYGFALLSDLDMEQMLVFSKEGYTFGQNICVEFLIPKSFILSGEVRGASHIGRTSKIISETKPDYRIQLNFSYLFDGERSSLRDFLKSVEPTIPPAPKKLKRPETDDDDDDDDEFEDLGF
jgi:hypothetical protein